MTQIQLDSSHSASPVGTWNSRKHANSNNNNITREADRARGRPEGKLRTYRYISLLISTSILIWYDFSHASSRMDFYSHFGPISFTIFVWFRYDFLLFHHYSLVCHFFQFSVYSFPLSVCHRFGRFSFRLELFFIASHWFVVHFYIYMLSAARKSLIFQMNFLNAATRLRSR